MKWRMTQIQWKAALVLGAIASFVLAAGADLKW